MTDRERAKEAMLKAMGEYLGPPCPHSPIWHINLDAMLDAAVLVVDPIIRADERRRESLAVCECGCRERDAHAEAVAAQLVEVICEQDRLLAWHWRYAGEFKAGRDAARAELAALRGALDVAIRLLSDVGITCTVESLIEEAERG